MTESIAFYLDPMCPYANQTAIWIREVRRLLPDGLDVEWRFFSLEAINQEAGKPSPWDRDWAYGIGQMQVGALIRREHGQAGVDHWYETISREFFESGRSCHVPDLHAEIVAEAGFAPDLVERALADPTTKAEVRVEHEDAVERYGTHGVPTIVLPGDYAVFGPVVVPAPQGDDALALWNLVRASARFPHFYELRHPKTAADVRHIGGHFRTYLSTRAWKTISNPAP
ncbi:MAG: DsbA family protein [Actinomycetota bacterium]